MGQLEFRFPDEAQRGQRMRNALQMYGIAAGMVLASAALRKLMDPFWHDEMVYVAFFPAAIISVFFLTRGPALFTVITSALVVNWFFVEPRYSFAYHELHNAVAALLYLSSGIALVFIADKRRQALENERRIAAALQARTTELSASEEFNRRMLASIPDCVNMLNLDGLTLSVNEPGKRLLQIDDPASWLRRSWVELWPAQNREMVRTAVNKARAGELCHFVTECPTAQGNRRWWDVVVSPINDANGRPERLLAISRDITERQLAEAHRQESEERRRLALAATGDAVWDLDLANDRFSCNDAYQTDYGEPGEEHWRQWWLKHIHPDDQKRVNAALVAALNGTTTNWISEYRFLRADGQWGHVLDRAYIARDSEGRPKRLVGAMMNLLPLRKAEWRAELLAETSSVLLATESPERVVDELCGKVLAFLDCDAFFNFLLDGENGALRLNACRGIPAESKALCDTVDCSSLCGCVAHGGQPIVAEDIQGSADPRVSLVKTLGMQAYACNPLMVRGKVIGTLSFGTKKRTRFEEEELSLMKAVTDQVAIAMERQMSAAELRRMNEELEGRVSQRTQSLAETTDQLNSFCYSVAHDLRAPLRTQMGFARLVLDEYGAKLDETGQYYLKAIMQAAERQSNIIQDLMAHVNVSRADLSMEVVDVNSAVQQAQSDLEAELQQKHAEIDASGIDGHAVVANRSSLHLVLLNLLSNACKFVPAGVQPRIRLQTQRRGAFIRLWVEDNGIGIAPEDHKRLFGMFQRLKKGDFPGTGMGLAIVKKAVERMGGSVGLESETGKGCRFWFELKQASRREAPKREDALAVN